MSGDATLTEVLARIFGLYMLAAGIGVALNADHVSRIVEEMRHSAFAFYLGGLIAFAIGAAIVSLHNDFSGPLAIFITLIGWVALIEGVIMLALPNVMQAFADRLFDLIGTGRVWGVAVAVFGVLLLVAGLA